jgi:hypothetical protein
MLTQIITSGSGTTTGSVKRNRTHSRCLRACCGSAEVDWDQALFLSIRDGCSKALLVDVSGAVETSDAGLGKALVCWVNDDAGWGNAGNSDSSV